MKHPSEIAKILRIELQATKAHHEPLSGPVYGSKQYRYRVTFNDSVTFSRLRKKVGLVEEKEGLPLKIVGIEPKIEQTEQAIEARYTVTVRETEDRQELVNRDLHEFTDEA